MTTATAQRAVPNCVSDDTRRLLARMNPSLFHGLGIALVLDAAAVARAQHAATPASSLVLKQRQDRLRELRVHAAALWPELAWERVCADAATVLPFHLTSKRGWNTGRARAAYYRGLAGMCEESGLRARLSLYAAQEENAAALHGAHLKLGVAARIGRFVSSLRALRHCDDVLRSAYRVLHQHWAETPPLAAMTFEQARSRTLKAWLGHVMLDPELHLLCRLWTRGLATSSRPARPDPTPNATPGWRPGVLLAAAGTAALD